MSCYFNINFITKSTHFIFIASFQRGCYHHHHHESWWMPSYFCHPFLDFLTSINSNLTRQAKKNWESCEIEWLNFKLNYRHKIRLALWLVVKDKVKHNKRMFRDFMNKKILQLEYKSINFHSPFIMLKGRASFQACRRINQIFSIVY